MSVGPPRLNHSMWWGSPPSAGAAQLTQPPSRAASAMRWPELALRSALPSHSGSPSALKTAGRILACAASSAIRSAATGRPSS